MVVGFCFIVIAIKSMNDTWYCNYLIIFAIKFNKNKHRCL